MSLGEASASALAEELKDEKCSLEVFTLTNGRLSVIVWKSGMTMALERKMKVTPTMPITRAGKKKKTRKEEEKVKKTTAMMNALGQGFVKNKSLKRMILDGTKVGAYELLKGISRAKENK